ncbi:MAG: phage holin family protein [Hyphomicrobiales bacterium]|nr:MAG: phage holin family protein [Hyphomicrobiales bacterium]
MSHAEQGRPLGDLLTGLASDITGLFRKEIQLAKAEASEKLDDAIKAGRSLAIGAILAIGATGVFLAALVTGLAALLINMGMAETPAGFVAGLIVTAVIGGIAWMLISRGLAELKANKLDMQRTARSLQMDAAAVKESF